VRVLAALSGGVDSAVAAARMVDAGHDVVGVHLALAGMPTRSGSRGCCSREDARDAARVADVLGIPFYVWDVSQRFRAEVVDDFVAEYAAGRTPNPCLRCNETIKFAAVLDRALALGFGAVATGHYARLETSPEGTVTLLRAADGEKDQSYVLSVLPQHRLRHAAFPLGASVKSEVREEASHRGLAVAAKPDSHDICFVPDGDTSGFLARHLGPAPGPVVDGASGEVVGSHDGAYAFTVGQRKGLRIGRPAPDGRPRYVLDVSPLERTVTVGPRAALAVDGAHLGTPVWCGVDPGRAFAALGQYRAHGDAVPVDVRPGSDGAGWVAVFAAPQHGVAPGQTLALYDGDRVLGSARITATWRHEPASVRA